MFTKTTLKIIDETLKKAQKIVIVQADNPDGDSLASSLALEEILGDNGKNVFLYCGVDIPEHLRYISGWDRVQRELPKQFDASIVVDTSTETLLEQLELTNQKMWLKNRPCIVLDHHNVQSRITFATVTVQPPAVATGEVIYELSKALGWKLNANAQNNLAIAILTDSLGLMSEGTSARSIQIIAELVEAGVSLANLENKRREMSKRPPELVHYKGALLTRVNFTEDAQIATIDIPWEEIEKYSHAYNPSMLVLDDMRLAIGTRVAIAFKIYPDGKVTAKIRCNFGSGIAGVLAENFGGGGHSYAAGFKTAPKTDFAKLKSECISKTQQLLKELDEQNA